MPKRFQSNTSSSVQFRLSDLQALLLEQPRLCSLRHRSAVLNVIKGLVEREFLQAGAHPHFYTRTPAGEAALLLFKHFGGVVATEDRLSDG